MSLKIGNFQIICTLFILLMLYIKFNNSKQISQFMTRSDKILRKR